MWRNESTWWNSVRKSAGRRKRAISLSLRGVGFGEVKKARIVIRAFERSVDDTGVEGLAG
jgi:predicted deacetylase